jgi:serine/threonine protein kinase
MPHVTCRLFMAGHVSKASDVYAYGILLYELITGQRAYAGVPVPLLPHEVALQGLRPEWPKNMPAESLMLRDLAEACWQHKPQDRCVCVLEHRVKASTKWLHIHTHKHSGRA